MKARRTYARFQPNDTPKVLPPPGHPDWEEWEPPRRIRSRELGVGELAIAWTIKGTFQQTSGGYYPGDREDAWRWIMWEDDPNVPWTFSWCCKMVGLEVRWVIETWEAAHGKIQRPTEQDRWLWNVRAARKNRQKRARNTLTGSEHDHILGGEGGI